MNLKFSKNNKKSDIPKSFISSFRYFRIQNSEKYFNKL